MSADSSAIRRRNGRLAACDPCRARKVSCDHARPVCTRCRRRGGLPQCRYPVPDQGPAWAHASSLDPVPDPVAAATARAHSSSAASGSQAPSPVTGPRAGYFGYTSSTNVLEETEGYLASVAGATSTTDSGDQAGRPERPQASLSSLPLPLRETCLAVLRCLPGHQNAQMTFCQEEAQGGAGGVWDWSRAAVDGIARALGDDGFGLLLAGGDAGLQAMADALCRNTARPLSDDCADADEWIGQFCGRNLRWEALGLLWAHLVRIGDPVTALKGSRLRWLEGRQSLRLARDNLSYCIELARSFTDANALLLDLCARRTVLCTMIEGDASISAYSSHGTVVTMLEYLGLHALDNHPAYTPTFSSEYKRRLASRVMSGDKEGSAFTGRPPLLSRRYFSTPMPLDISDGDLAAGGARLAAACESLDERGWNTAGALHPATMVRARHMFGDVREELVEIALSRSMSVSPDHLIQIRARQVAILSSCPSSIIYRPGDLSDPAVGESVLYIRIVVFLDHLQNVFLAERLLLRHGHADDGDLLITSFDMVSLTLKLWTHKDRFSDYTMIRNFEWLLMAYGAPGGGILCQELLSPTFAGTHPRSPGLTRSSIVQQLSLLVGFLDWVRPSAPNGDLCASSKAVIQRVLDHHLNAAPGGGGGGGGSGGSVLNSMDWTYLSQPDFNFELLDTFDWLRTDGP